MLKKTITYTDYNGVERTEDLYFNLTKSEIVEWQLGVDGGLSELLVKIVNAREIPQLVKYFKELILRSYGEKTDDGRRFVKSEEISEAFSQTPAYDQLYMEFLEDEEAAGEFVKGILPENFGNEFANELDKIEAEQKDKITDIRKTFGVEN